ncbi:hypothetical protein Tco_0870064 [Tanacetum coccineum]
MEVGRMSFLKMWVQRYMTSNRIVVVGDSVRVDLGHGGSVDDTSGILTRQECRSPGVRVRRDTSSGDLVLVFRWSEYDSEYSDSWGRSDNERFDVEVRV